MKIARRTKPWPSLLIASMAGLCWFLVLVANGYRTAQIAVVSNSLENQVARYLPATASTEKYDFDALFDEVRNGPERAKARAKVCSDLVAKLIENPVGKQLTISPEVRRQLLAENECGFHEPTASSFLYFRDYTLKALLVSLSVYVISLLTFWVGTYPQLGWRRVALVFGPTCGVSGGIYMLVNDADDPIKIIVLALITAIVSALSVVVTRETYLWVRRGFDENERQA